MKNLDAKVHEIVKYSLLYLWDPAGISEHPEAADEYDSYVGDVVNAILKKNRPELIADLLSNIENELMFLPSDHAKNLRIAKFLSALYPPSLR